MPDPSAVYETLELACEALKKSEESLRWEWEGRFDAALTVYTAEEEPKVRGVLGEHFQSNWDAGTLSQAPAHILQFANSVGGLRGGQELFVADAAVDPTLVIALWPWGGGSKTSLRIWLLSTDVPDDVRAKIHERFRSQYS